ncbi:MAG TPA: protein kinase [Rubrobacter sp.]|nr:protein kinase [Rubrobacter sp.]
MESELGSGGMARVFLGRDEVLDRAVAVKLLNPVHGGTDIGDRFEREGRTAARLAHPNIVQVYDAGEAEFNGRETSFIVMEYVPGGDLKALIDQKGRLPGSELARLGDEVCAGLAHAHEHGVIHRDIKPHNILLDENGHAKVTDFGIARALDATQATRTGYFLGTAMYSSPEQLQGQKVTPKSDVYSLGTTLYQAATGETPFAGDTPIEVASQHVSKTPTPPRQRGADVSEDLAALILSCLAKNPDDRPTAEEARSRLREAIPTAGATQAQPAAPTRAEQTRPAPGDGQGRVSREDRRGRRGGLLAVLALFAVLVVIGALAAQNFMGGGQNPGSNGAGQKVAQGGNEGQSDGEPGGNGSQGGGQQSAATSSAESAPSQDNSGKGDQGTLTAQAAEQTIRDFYKTAAGSDYESAWDFLTPRYKRDIGSRGNLTNQFRTLESIEFTDGPTAEVNGDTAEVSFSTIARHEDRVDRPTLTATLVKVDGEWKIDDL